MIRMFSPRSVALAAALFAAALPAKAYVITTYNAAAWQTNATAGFIVEDFEDLFLAPGLQVQISGSTANFGPAGTLPYTFNPNTDDPNAGKVFANGVWDGSGAIRMMEMSYNFSAIKTAGLLWTNLMPNKSRLNECDARKSGQKFKNYRSWQARKGSTRHPHHNLDMAFSLSLPLVQGAGLGRIHALFLERGLQAASPFGCRETKRSPVGSTQRKRRKRRAPDLL